MGSRRTVEEKLITLKQIDSSLLAGITVVSACENAGVAKQTYYRWRDQYGGITLSKLKEIERLEHENRKLKKRLRKKKQQGLRVFNDQVW